MLFFSMGLSLDGFVADRDGDFNWSVPDDELFEFHTDRIRELGAEILGRRLYETMRVWETDPAMRHDEASIAFADLWTALPKVVFSRTLDRVEGNARLARRPLADEVAEVVGSTDGDVEIGGADLASQAFEQGLVDELRIFRYPVVVGGGTAFFPPVTERVDLELVETRTFGDQVIYERHAVNRG
ncbi:MULTISPECIES: dihydrofolate reductase family protein [Gordonia]|uniref:Dihydrofolate reductase family protein n=1 Tax=Gordonia amicalis TaxID=89053 RepID=A0AAE4R5E4_9ACTN|nr:MULTISPECIES: dihydrofolate reductase family protein [Gordonia]ATD72411.1 deaminase [Gordonia sp. 1D]MCZ4579091.1 dihydrofolate reductase family protein [Gordonia amicalis]MCZ4652634.1 dihydrofolate reductase family protein [Gordonia amicalis]MDJ0454451.1 dihydrofolate reductase family protein [Gordonia amicalis]MDV6309798.1 dihydrofolate reductase family protein [Gordonia amicalis]